MMQFYYSLLSKRINSNILHSLINITIIPLSRLASKFLFYKLNVKYLFVGIN